MKISNEAFLEIFTFFIVSFVIICVVLYCIYKFLEIEFKEEYKEKYWKTLYYKYYNDTNKLLEIIREKQVRILDCPCKPKRSFLKEIKYHKKALKNIYRKDYKNQRHSI